MVRVDIFQMRNHGFEPRQCARLAQVNVSQTLSTRELFRVANLSNTLKRMRNLVMTVQRNTQDQVPARRQTFLGMLIWFIGGEGNKEKHEKAKGDKGRTVQTRTVVLESGSRESSRQWPGGDFGPTTFEVKLVHIVLLRKRQQPPTMADVCPTSWS